MRSEGEDAGAPATFDPVSKPADWVPESVPAIEEQRVLIGFLGPDDAIGRLRQAEQVRSPVDTSEIEDMDPEEIERENEEAIERYREQWQQARESVPELGPFRADEVRTEELPDDPDIKAHIEEYTGKDLFQETMENVPDDAWSFKRVPIDALVAFQPQVTTTAYEEIPTWDDGPLAVLEYCFQTETSTLQMTTVDKAQDGNYIRAALTSRSPNFQIAGLGVESGGAGTDIHVPVKPKPNFVQVARFQDRYILKNGYHRTFQLMRAGEEHVPAVVREVDTYEDTGAAKQGFFPPQIVMADRPPVMPDYTSGAAVTMETPGTNTVIEVTVTKKLIPR